MDIRTMIAAGYKPCVSPSCTGKRDADGRKIEVFFYMKPNTRCAGGYNTPAYSTCKGQ